MESLTRTPGSHVRVSFTQPDHPIAYGYPARTHVFRQNFPLYAAPRQLAAHGLLHDVPRWAGRRERRRHGMGRPEERRAVPRQRAGVGRGQYHRPPRHFRHACGTRARGGVQLQPATPGPESRRSAIAVERHPELAGHSQSRPRHACARPDRLRHQRSALCASATDSSRNSRRRRRARRCRACRRASSGCSLRKPLENGARVCGACAK